MTHVLPHTAPKPDFSLVYPLFYFYLFFYTCIFFLDEISLALRHVVTQVHEKTKLFFRALSRRQCQRARRCVVFSHSAPSSPSPHRPAETSLSSPFSGARFVNLLSLFCFREALALRGAALSRLSLDRRHETLDTRSVSAVVSLWTRDPASASSLCTARFVLLGAAIFARLRYSFTWLDRVSVNDKRTAAVERRTRRPHGSSSHVDAHTLATFTRTHSHTRARARTRRRGSFHVTLSVNGSVRDCHGVNRNGNSDSARVRASRLVLPKEFSVYYRGALYTSINSATTLSNRRS